MQQFPIIFAASRLSMDERSALPKLNSANPLCGYNETTVPRSVNILPTSDFSKVMEKLGRRYQYPDCWLGRTAASYLGPMVVVPKWKVCSFSTARGRLGWTNSSALSRAWHTAYQHLQHEKTGDGPINRYIWAMGERPTRRMGNSWSNSIFARVF